MYVLMKGYVMNNTIDSCRNVTFNSRYLRMHNSERFPRKVYDAIYKSDAIEKFLNDGKPKTFFERIADLFKKDEYLDVFYSSNEITGKDPYAKNAMVQFSFGKGHSVESILNIPKTPAVQKGIRRPTGSIPKQGENPLFKAPQETVEYIIAKKIEEISDFGSLLKKF